MTNIIQVPRHRVFISFHHADQSYKDSFANMMGDDIVDESVGDGDIDDDRLATDTIRQRIRDGFIRDATVTVVLIGPCTWQRKHVDWEIGSSLRSTQNNSRAGLLGILLPNQPDFGKQTYNSRLIPPRLAINCGKDDPYALIYDWPGTQGVRNLRDWIHTAFLRRSGTPPHNNSQQFQNNRSGDCSRGWQD